MRTRTTSIAKSCPVCGTFNRVVIYSTEIRPAFSINCSRCRASIFTPGAAGRAAARVSPAPLTARPEVSPGPSGRPVKPNHLAAAGRHRRRDGRSAVPPGGRAPKTEAPCGVRGRAVRIAAGVVAQMTMVATAAALMLGFALDSTPPSAVSRQVDRTELTASAEPAITEHNAAPRLAAAAGPGEATARRSDKRLLDGAAGRIKAKTPALVPALSAPMTYPASWAPVLAAAPDLSGAATTEAALDLPGSTRREVQRRLSLTRRDRVLVDGVFGPTTRTAIAAWQKDAGLEATGYLDAHALETLFAQTENAYRAWKIAARKRGKDRARLAALESPIPVASPAAMRDDCLRFHSGEIVYGQTIRCDFRGLQEDLGSLRDEVAELLRSS